MTGGADALAVPAAMANSLGAGIGPGQAIGCLVNNHRAGTEGAALAMAKFANC
jgi:hypothetical protein